MGPQKVKRKSMWGQRVEYGNESTGPQLTAWVQNPPLLYQPHNLWLRIIKLTVLGGLGCLTCKIETAITPTSEHSSRK